MAKKKSKAKDKGGKGKNKRGKGAKGGAKKKDSAPREVSKPVFKKKVIPKPSDPSLRHIVRIANTDIPGGRSLLLGLQDIKGVGFMFANAICNIAKLDPQLKVGKLDEKQEEELTKLVQDPIKAGMPVWLLNRRNNPFEGGDTHLIGPNVRFVRDNDIKLMRKLKTYKGVRHSKGLPVRGQSTKSNFRKNKRRMMRKRR